jgi:hypothetical protein
VVVLVPFPNHCRALTSKRSDATTDSRWGQPSKKKKRNSTQADREPARLERTLGDSAVGVVSSILEEAPLLETWQMNQLSQGAPDPKVLASAPTRPSSAASLGSLASTQVVPSDSFSSASAPVPAIVVNRGEFGNDMRVSTGNDSRAVVPLVSSVQYSMATSELCAYSRDRGAGL